MTEDDQRRFWLAEEAVKALTRIATAIDKAQTSPHTCPVCVGGGTVAKSKLVGAVVGHNTEVVQCTPCRGLGIVWS